MELLAFWGTNPSAQEQAEKLQFQTLDNNVRMFLIMAWLAAVVCIIILSKASRDKKLGYIAIATGAAVLAYIIFFAGVMALSL